jgi:uncharacterized protein with gpF-like domain
MAYNVSKGDQDKSFKRDHALKLALELLLLPKLAAEFSRVVAGFKQSVSKFGHPQSTIQHRQNLYNMLLKHYDTVEKKFSSQIIKELGLPDAHEIIRQTIDLNTDLHHTIRANQMADNIALTTQKNIHNSMIKAILAAAAAGIALNRSKLAENGGTFLDDALKSRIETIAISETQNPAEHAKQTEIDSLHRHAAKFKGITETIAKKKKFKMWQAVLDNKTRLTHAEADSQQVPFDQPYIVGGEQLRYPGDMGLGASIENIINCRCSSIIIIL